MKETKKKTYLKVIGIVIIALAIIGQLAGCGGKSETPAPENSTPVEASAPEDNVSEGNNVPVNGKIGKVKTYEIKRADNDKVTFELFYREGSDYVAKITGGIYVPAGSSEYDAMLADVVAFQNEVDSTNLSEDIMQFRYNEVKLSNGYLEYSFLFSELDADNVSSVAMVAEFLGLPVEGEYLKLSDCEQYLVDNGFILTHEM